jgi:3-deoxy-7-phosphoheptulonate synthase
MVESFLVAGNQPIPSDRSRLKYGCSITDACVGWETTAQMVRDAHQSLSKVLPHRERPQRSRVA